MLTLKEIEKQYPNNLKPYKRNILREYLQYKILEIIFNSSLANKLSFLGGTALRIAHNNTRFSENLDFDNFGLTETEFTNLTKEAQKGMTKLGLETRAIGESPKAADVVGVNVTKRRYLSTIIGSALIGIAGAYLPILITGTYTPDISAGRGFMAIGIAIFASWRPERAILGGFLFAAIEVIAFRLQVISQRIPYQFLLMLPFILVLVVMIIFNKQIEFPASVGKPYSRE